MRRVRYIAGRELLQNRRDGLAALFTIILPVVFTLFLGLMIGGAHQNTFPLAVADADASATSQELVKRLGDSPLLTLKVMRTSEVDKAVKDQKVAGALVIPKGFGATVDSGNTAFLGFIRVETSSGAQSVQRAVETVVSQLGSSVLVAKTATERVSAATGAGADDALRAQARLLAETNLSSPALTSKSVEAGRAGVAPAGGFDQSSTGGLVNWVLFGVLGIAATTVWERKQGLLRRLSISGAHASEIIGGKLLAMVVIAFLQQLLLVIVGRFALGVDYFNAPLALLLTMLSLSGLAAAFGLLVALLFRSEQAVVATTIVSAQLLAALGGAWFPLEVTNAGFSQVAHVLPSAWIMDSLHGIVLGTWSLSDVLEPLAIVWAWIIGIVSIAIWRYRTD